MHSIAQSGCDRHLEELVKRLIDKESRNECERRSVHRTPFVRPVTVRIIGDDDKTITAFSKNISPKGIGLILEDAISDGAGAKLTIHSLKNQQVHVRSELRWCRPFGNGWFISGWKFIAEERR